MGTHRTLRVSALSFAIMSALAAPVARATEIVVNHTSCTLRDAVAAANNNVATGGCPAGSAVDRDVVRIATGNTEMGSSGSSIAIRSDMDIVGTSVGGVPPQLGNEGGGRMFVIGGEGPDGPIAPNVRLSNFSFFTTVAQPAGAGAGGGGGGASLGGMIYVHDASLLVIDRLSITNTRASGGASGGSTPFAVAPGGGGGGMAGTGGTPTNTSTPGHGTAFGFGGGGGAGAAATVGVNGGNGGAFDGISGGAGGIIEGGGPTSGGFGGGGGGGASNPVHGGANGGAGGGGGGGSPGSNFGPGGIGGAGGFGGGGGAGGGTFSGTTGAQGGAGGFGAGGGGAGFVEGTNNGGLGGSFGANAAGMSGGAGAGLGGALFIRSGRVHLESIVFDGSQALAGSGAQAKGGAIFVLDTLNNANGNQSGMPASLPVVTGCGDSFSASAAANAGTVDTDNVDTFGTSRAALVAACARTKLVSGNAQVIAAGDVSPSLDDHTDFGMVPAAGSASFVRTYTIANTGNAILTGGIELGGGDFSSVGANNFSLAPGASASIMIRFEPVARGVRAGSVLIFDNAGAGDHVFAIAGTGANSLPSITQGDNITVTMSEDGAPTAFALDLESTDPDFDPQNWSIATPPPFGTASVDDDGIVSYVPPPNTSAPASFVVELADGFGGSDAITVNVVVEPVDDAPLFVAAGPFSISDAAPAGEPVGTVVANNGDGGSSGSGITYAVVGGSGQAVFNINPTLGLLRVADAALLAAASGTTLALQVRADDGLQQTTTTVGIAVRPNAIFANGYEGGP